MKNLGVLENDFQESFIRSSGPGGQKVNKSSSCVYLVHIPTGLSVKCQKERSQSLNRFLARRLLLDKIEKQQKGFVTEEKERLEKIRRQKRKRSKRAKEKILIAKHQQAEKKVLRGKVDIFEE
jgi:protein subunit release factor B